MKRMPRHLNTKADYLYVRQNFPAAQWLPRWQELLDDRWMWQRLHNLAPSDPGIEDLTHGAQTETDEFGKERRYQTVLVEDPNARIFTLGFTVDEVTSAIEEAQR